MYQTVSKTGFHSDGKQTTFIFLLVLFSLNFFSATFALGGMVKIFSFLFLFATIIVSIPYFLHERAGFAFPVKLIFLSILFSNVMAYFSWGQSISNSVSTIPYLIWIAFFFLLKIRYPVEKLESVILVFGLTYVILYFFQFLNSDVVSFGYQKEFGDERGITRIDFPGGGIFYLSLFICLTRALKKNHLRWMYIVAVGVGLAVTVLQVTRQSIAIVFLITFIHVLRQVSAGKKIFVIGIFASLVFLFYSSTNTISKGLKDQQKETSSEGLKYIRVLAGEYFINDFSPNLMSRVFGNGFPNNLSYYGMFTQSLENEYGFYLADVGLIGFYAMFGVLPIIAFLIIFYKSYHIKVPARYMYLKYYILFIFLTAFSSNYSYSFNYVIATVFVLYVFQTIYNSQENNDWQQANMNRRSFLL